MLICVPTSVNSSSGIKTRGKNYVTDENIKNSFFGVLDPKVSEDKNKLGVGIKSSVLMIHKL